MICNCLKHLCFFLLAPVAGMAALSVSAKLDASTDTGRTTYTYTITGAPQGTELHFHLTVDNAFASPLKGSSMQRLSPVPADCSDPCYAGTATNAQPDLVLLLDAQSTQTTPTAVTWSSSLKDQGMVVAPVDSFDATFFSILVGSGTLLTSRSAINYEVLQNTNTLSATGIGRNHVDLLVGGSFNLGFHKPVWKPLSAFISLKFTPGSSNTINGFVFGGGYRITKYLDIIAGVGLTPIREPAVGLRRVAYNIVSQSPSDPLYTGFIAQDLLLNRGQAPFDGFPLQRNGQAIYAGNPLETHYRTGAFVGVAFPLKIHAALAGQGK